ncbi:MAG: hypothetical protein IT374_12100 [Polyangiaceae bacterium]|nr:hypothetical protein [Polyangiaceae bacterium]
MSILPLSRALLGALSASLLLACSDSSSSGSAGPTPTTRTPTCLATLDALCDRSADRCHSSARAECDDSAQSLFCRSDAIVQPCLDALPLAGCADSPAACLGIADPAPAQALCKQFIDDWCSFGERCNLESKAACVASASSSLNCANAIGISPSFPECQAEISALACPAAGVKPALPAKCLGIVKVSSSSASLEVSMPGAQAIEPALEVVRAFR